MQNDINEFVFKRRRKRPRTTGAQETEAIASLDLASDVGHQAGLIPEIAALPEPATSSPAPTDYPEPPRPEVASENIVTVERFLRGSVQTGPRTKQADPCPVPASDYPAYNHHRPAERQTTRVRKVAKASKRPQEPRSRIAKTLFRAAVLTDGDPLDDLVDDAGISRARRPLKFVPFNRHSAPWRPRKTDSIQPSKLSCAEEPRRHGKTSNIKQLPYAPNERVPLHFVPVQEAEAAYSVMFPSRRVY